MRVYLFMDRFAEKVRDRSKRQTIRAGFPRCKPGDALSLRRWTGKPYRSKQEVICEGVCRKVTTFSAHVVSNCGWTVWVDCEHVYGDALDNLAALDGFDNAEDMKAWFLDVHGCDFNGYIVQWEPSVSPPLGSDCICFGCGTALHNGGDGDCACEQTPWFDGGRCGPCRHNLVCDVARHPHLYPRDPNK